MLKICKKLQEKRFVFVKILAIIIPENGAKVSKIKCLRLNQQTLNKVFFLKRVNDVASLETFFSCFDSEVKGYSVYFTVHKELAKFSGLLSEKMPENSIVILDNNKIPKGIQKIEGYSVIEIKNLNAYDEYSAYEMGKSIIGLLNHFYSFFRYVHQFTTL